MKPALPSALFFLILASPPSALATEEEQDGPRLWRERCKSCHGLDGRAQTRMGVKEDMPDLTVASWQRRRTDAALRQVITEGSSYNRKMRAYGPKLSAEAIEALVAHIRTLDDTKDDAASPHKETAGLKRADDAKNK